MQYVGCFEIENENILICDPMATELANKFYQVQALNVARLRIDHVPNGIWYCYHVYDSRQLYPVGMLITQKQYDISSMSYDEILNEWSYEGKVCCGFGRMVCTVDRNYFEAADYAYTLFDDNVVYEITELKKWCEKNLPLDRNKYALLSILSEKEKANDTYIEAAEISHLLTDYVPKIKNSSLWSVDCMLHCDNRSMAAGTIKGGAVSKCSVDFASVYRHPSSAAIYITIDNGEPCFQQKTADYIKKALFKVV